MSDHDDMVSAVRASVEQLSTVPSEAAEKGEIHTSDNTIEETESASERVRDEKGRFVASDEKPEQPVRQAAPEAKEVPEVAPSTALTLKPPTSWPPEAKNEFAKLPPAVQQAVLKREGEISNGFQQYSDERQRLKTIEGIIAPRRDYYQKYGFKSDAEAINHLFTLSDFLERDPYGAVAHIARSAGVDLNRLISGGAQQPQPQQHQPQTFQQSDIQQQVSEAVAMQFAKMTVQEFEQNPPEHYQEVKPLMQMLLEKGHAQDLQDAYDKAVWMNPDIRSRMLEAQKAEEEAKRLATQQAKVEKKTKAANASLNGAPHGTPATAPPKAGPKGTFGDVADDVRAAISALM